MENKVLYGCKCKRCGKEWYSREEHPLLCVKCHSAYWDRDKLRRNTADNRVNKDIQEKTNEQ